MRNLDSPWHLAEGVTATVPHRLASGHVVQLWRAGPEPHLQSWYQPAAILCHGIRPAEGPAPLLLDELLFVGRVDEPGGLSLFVYRHRRSGVEVLLDAEGVPFGPVDDPRRRTGHRFAPIDPSAVLAELRAGPLHPALSPIADDGDGDGDGPLAVVLPFRRPSVDPDDGEPPSG